MTTYKTKSRVGARQCIKSLYKTAIIIISTVDRGLTPDVVVFAMVADVLMAILLASRGVLQ